MESWFCGILVSWLCGIFSPTDLLTVFLTNFRETRKKYDIVFNQNGTVTYRQRRRFFFMRNMSVGAETDIFTTVNPPVLVSSPFVLLILAGFDC